MKQNANRKQGSYAWRAFNQFSADLSELFLWHPPEGLVMLGKMKSWFQGNPLPLQYMDLGPKDKNPLMMQFFTWDHLRDDISWWKYFELEVPRLVELGFTHVWLPPPNKAAKPSGRGYDAYDLWDLGEFNQKGTVKTRWGTKEEYLSACKVAQEHGIHIIIDAVLNHKLGADRLESVRAVPVHSDNRLKESGRPREIQAWTGFDFPGRGDTYSTMRWNQEHFSGIDWDHKTRTKSIFKFVGQGHKGWSRNVDTERGNYDYLLGSDIDFRHPAVQRDLMEWGKWVLETTGAVGFRLDAIKHMDRIFLLDWIQNVRRQSGKTDMFSVAEYWSPNIKTVLQYIQAFKGETTFFDVPLHMNFHKASRERTRFDLRRIFQSTVVQLRPWDAVTFVDNHDFKVEGQSLESWVGDNFKVQAYALILLRGYGLPCVFYGDLYPTEETVKPLTAKNLEQLLEARKKYAYGPTVDYFSDQNRNCVGFVRKGDEICEGCAVILSNKEEQEGRAPFVHELRMNVGIENANKKYGSLLTRDGVVDIDAEGWGIFTCFANEVQVWIKLPEDAVASSDE